MTYKNWDQEVKKLSATDRAIYKKAIKALMKWPVFKQELGWQVEQIGILRKGEL